MCALSETKHDIALPVQLYIFASWQEFLLNYELVNHGIKNKFAMISDL
jgi:hypothetical protein